MVDKADFSPVEWKEEEFAAKKAADSSFAH